MKKSIKLLFVFLIIGQFCVGQINDNGSVDGPMTTAQIQAFSNPLLGQTIYSTDTNTDWQYNGTQWVDSGSGGGSDTGAQIVSKIDTELGGTEWKSGDTTLPLINSPTFTGATSGNVNSSEATQTYIDSQVATKQDELTLTTTGTSGSATLSNGTLNIPQYSGGTGTTYTFSIGLDESAGTVTVNKSELNLDQVDNTPDANKPTSNATQTALDGKVDDTQVLTDVPANAVFTDTQLSDAEVSTAFLNENQNVDLDSTDDMLKSVYDTNDNGIVDKVNWGDLVNANIYPDTDLTRALGSITTNFTSVYAKSYIFSPVTTDPTYTTNLGQTFYRSDLGQLSYWDGTNIKRLATESSLNGKADDADVVKLTGAQTINSRKTFVSGAGSANEGFAIKEPTGLDTGAVIRLEADYNGGSTGFSFGAVRDATGDYFSWNNASGVDLSTNYAMRLNQGTGEFRLSDLSGTGNRMVVADEDGDLSTQAIPSGGGSSLPDGDLGDIIKSGNSLTIQDGSVSSLKIGVNSVDSSALNNDAVQTAHISNNAVTPAKLQEGVNGQVLKTDASGDVVWEDDSFVSDNAITGDRYLYENGSNAGWYINTANNTTGMRGGDLAAGTDSNVGVFEDRAVMWVDLMNLVVRKNAITLVGLTNTMIDSTGDTSAVTNKWVKDEIATSIAGITSGSGISPNDIGATDKTLTTADFEKFNYTDNSLTLTLDNTPPVGSRGLFQPTDISSVITIVPSTGVTLVGNGVGVITDGFEVDSLNVGSIFKLADNLYSVSGFVKPFESISSGIYDILNAINDGTGNETNAITDVSANNTNGSVSSTAATGGATGSYMGIYNGSVAGGNQIYIKRPSGVVANTTYDISIDVACDCSGRSVDLKTTTSDGWTTTEASSTNNDDGTWEELTITATTDGVSGAASNDWRVRLSIGSFGATDNIKYDNIRWAEQE